jgi:hypothetical protein
MPAAVDVILPTHRRPHTIAYAVEAVLRQTHSDFALHVVGDGCDDATEAAVRRVSDARVHVHRFAKARGFGYANRNHVLRATSAPLIAYANDDDLWFPDHLERGLAALEQRGLDLVAFRSVHVQVPDLLDPHFFAFDWRVRLGTFLRNWFLGAGTLLHRRAVSRASGIGTIDSAATRVSQPGAGLGLRHPGRVPCFYAHTGTRDPACTPRSALSHRLVPPGASRCARHPPGGAGSRSAGANGRIRPLRPALGSQICRFWYERAAYAAGPDTTARISLPEHDA